MPGRILDLGCGRGKLTGAVGLDLGRQAGVDLVADFARGLPFQDDSFGQARLRHVVEHVADLAALLGEVHRVLEPGGLAHILTPHFSAAASHTDPSHRLHLGLYSFDYFCGLAVDDFRPLRFRYQMLGRRLIFGRGGGLGVAAWANRHGRFYEQHLAWLWPALEVEVWLKAVK
jgi:SAM-dependent methyltransferase